MGFNKALIITVLLVSIVGVGFMTLLTSMEDAYNVNVPTKYRTIFDNINQTDDLYQESAEIVEGGDINPDGQDEAVFKNVIIAGRQSMEYGKLANSMVTDSAEILGIPGFIIGIIITIIGVLTMFGFLGMITKRDP